MGYCYECKNRDTAKGSEYEIYCKQKKGKEHEKSVNDKWGTCDNYK